MWLYLKVPHLGMESVGLNLSAVRLVFYDGNNDLRHTLLIAGIMFDV